MIDFEKTSILKLFLISVVFNVLIFPVVFSVADAAVELYTADGYSQAVKAVVESLCAVNRVFEPGPRDYTSSLALFEVLPEGFWANWQSLLREDGELPGERKREIADLLARGIFALIP